MKVGITGHRNQRLGLPEDETDEKWTPIQFWIIDELSKFIKTCADNNEPLDKCDVLLAIWDGNKSGGVWSTIRKAQKSRKENYLLSKRITY